MAEWQLFQRLLVCLPIGGQASTCLGLSHAMTNDLTRSWEAVPGFEPDDPSCQSKPIVRIDSWLGSLQKVHPLQDWGKC